MKYNFQKEFFLVRDDDTGTTKLFRHWWRVVDFLTDEIMKYNYHIIYDKTTAISFTSMAAWRAPENREECFNLLFNIENIKDLNYLVEDLWHIELVEFSD